MWYALREREGDTGMKKSFKVVALLLLIVAAIVLFLMFGNSKSNIATINSTISSCQSNSNLSANWIERNIDIAKEDGQTIGCITAASDLVYYEICDLDRNKQYYEKSTIYSADTNGHKELVTEITNGGKSFFTNELLVIDNSLFWVYRDSEKIEIQRFDLSTKKIDTISCYEPNTPDIVLSHDDQFVAWYVSNSNGVSLNTYHCKSRQIHQISNSITTDSPYTKAFVNDGIVAFLEKQSKRRILKIYDLQNSSIIFTVDVPLDFEITRLQANKDYIVCTNGYGSDNSLYILNKDTMKFDRFDLSVPNYNIFFCELYNDHVFIYSSKSKEIFDVSLSQNSFSEIQINKTLWMSLIGENGNYYAYDPVNSTIIELSLFQ